MSKTVIKLEDAPKRLHLKKMQIAGYLAHASAGRRILVGFYRDESGKIRPVTKSAVEVRRKKVVKHGKQFKGVKPQFKVVKGIRMSAKEYRAFVQYLNDFRIQEFTKSDVEEWLRFHACSRALSSSSSSVSSIKRKMKKYSKCPKCGRRTTLDKDGERIEINCPKHGRVAIFDRGTGTVWPKTKAGTRSKRTRYSTITISRVLEKGKGKKLTDSFTGVILKRLPDKIVLRVKEGPWKDRDLDLYRRDIKKIVSAK
jgi:hypothetical protein